MSSKFLRFNGAVERDDAPFGYVNVFTSHVNVGFFHGASLADPAGLMEGSGRFMRHVEAAPMDIKARVEQG